MSFARRIGMVVTIALLSVAALAAQAPLAAPGWQGRADLPDVDFTGLTAAQKTSALKMLREMGCTCGCDMKVAQCRVEDPACSYSKTLSGIVVKGFKEGKSAADVSKLVAASPVGKPRPVQKLLEDPIEIPVAGAPSTGPANAPILLVEFSDFECPFCSSAAHEIRTILAAYPKDVRLVYKQFPLSMHPHAELAATASVAAQEQGKFWELHDKMFANFRQLSQENILLWVKELGLDMDKFKAAFDSPKNKAIVKKDLQDGETAGVNGTPAVFVNGKHFNGPITLEALKPILTDELKAARSRARR